MVEPHGRLVVGPIPVVQNNDLLMAKPHTLMGVGVILAVQGEARAHPCNDIPVLIQESFSY